MYAHRVKPGEKVKLNDIPSKVDGGLTEKEAERKCEELGEELTDLQELLFAAGKTPLLIVLQGRDTSGKDGTIRHLLKYMNAQSTRVAPFKVPTPIELAHDYLWRVHSQTPGKGETVIFNRSHYEDVLVVRVHEFVAPDVWGKRFEHINNWEKLLTDSGTVVLKFMLHISKEEQERRLLDRERDLEKAWKLSAGDWKEREFWDSYTEAYEDVASKCSTESAPWHIISADHKWYRNLAITEAIVEAMRPLKKGWNAKLEEIGTKAKEDLAAFRAEAKS
ncbi:MAG: PPK2 family polyphosphate kinase [Fimbriimonadaceae bacterium]